MGFNQTLPATMYVKQCSRIQSSEIIRVDRYSYDVDPVTQMFKNRRVFAYTDNGVPDGIELDSNGNVYSGCGDGIQVGCLWFHLSAGGLSFALVLFRSGIHQES